MENKLMIFENDAFGKVRTLNLNGEPWFVAVDVCSVLDLSNPTIAVSRLDEDERAKFNLGRQGDATIVNEPGLYTLVLGSRKPEAKAFKRWITHEVIPAIRKHGVYITDEKLKLFAEHPELLDALMKSLYATHAENLRHRAERQTLLPKADYYDAFMDADGCTNLRTTAKELNVPERWFARFLQQTGFLYRSPAGNLMPYAIPRNRGLFRVRDYVRNGHSGAYTLITPMGKSLFRELLRCGEAVSN
ncbi:toxin Bro [Erysipelotrichaceae bacterium AF19-24AC]|jgi:prophage antirepressor-like protein|nr:toxin Bro [Erysipelotrichaceae bacterium AF19-24AC]